MNTSPQKEPDKDPEDPRNILRVGSYKPRSKEERNRIDVVDVRDEFVGLIIAIYKAIL